VFWAVEFVKGVGESVLKNNHQVIKPGKLGFLNQNRNTLGLSYRFNNKNQNIEYKKI